MRNSVAGSMPKSQAVAMLNHPNIVSVYDVSTNGDADYIVMELVDGITLKQYIERRGGYLNWKESLHFCHAKIAKALEHAHNQGIVHRDIKPHNVMILKNGSAKVTDFGIAGSCPPRAPSPRRRWVRFIISLRSRPRAAEWITGRTSILWVL